MSKEKSFKMELFFAALADRTRLRLLNLMGEDELCVCFFAEVIGTNQPKISRHLAYLKRANLVSARRDGKWMHYRVIEPINVRAKEVFAGIRQMLREDKEFQQDLKKLDAVCCSPAFAQSIVNIQSISKSRGAVEKV